MADAADSDSDLGGVQEGMFGLREWEDEGFTPQAQDVDDPSYDPTVIKKARQPSARVCTCLCRCSARVCT